jgi:hypothetical protein
VADHRLPLGACNSGIMGLKSSQEQRCVSAKKSGNIEMGQHCPASATEEKWKGEEGGGGGKKEEGGEELTSRDEANAFYCEQYKPII